MGFLSQPSSDKKSSQFHFHFLNIILQRLINIPATIQGLFTACAVKWDPWSYSFTGLLTAGSAEPTAAFINLCHLEGPTAPAVFPGCSYQGCHNILTPPEAHAEIELNLPGCELTKRKPCGTGWSLTPPNKQKLFYNTDPAHNRIQSAGRLLKSASIQNLCFAV